MESFVRSGQRRKNGVGGVLTNQLLALHSRQMIQDQQLRIAQDRATALEQARMVAANERSRAVRQYFMTGSTRYTPQDVNVYRN